MNEAGGDAGFQFRSVRPTAGRLPSVALQHSTPHFPDLANGKEYTAGVESLNTQAIVRPLTGMKPPFAELIRNLDFTNS